MTNCPMCSTPVDASVTNHCPACGTDLAACLGAAIIGPGVYQYKLSGNTLTFRND